MPRERDEGMIRVYRYGLLSPTQNGDVVREQMLLAHRYYNTLTEIERGRRAAIRAVHSSVGNMPLLETCLAEAETSLKVALEVQARERARTRKRTETAEMKAQIKSAREAVSSARREIREYRATVKENPDVVSRIEEIGTRANELQKNARAYCGLAKHGPHYGAWGTYLLSEAAAEQSRKTTPFYDDPGFRRWEGEGWGGAYVQGGVPVEDIFGSKSGALRVDPVDEKAWYSESRGERRKLSRTKVRLRLGSNEEGETIWGEWPMVMHRQIPPGSVVKNTVVSLKKIGPREEWSLLVTVDIPEEVHLRTCGSGRVAINLGWRVTGDKKVRVAVFVDEEGNAGEVEIQETFFTAMEKVESLRSIRDKNLDEVKGKFSEWVKSVSTLPPWFSEAVRWLPQWRSPEKFYRIARRWKENRFGGDEDGYVLLEAWRYRDHHLWAWETSQRSKSIRSRKDYYRVVAKTLTSRYGEIVLAPFDKREVAKRPAPEEGYENETARANRHRVAVSELEMQVKVSASSSRCSLIEVDGKDSTHICSECGSKEDFDAGADVRHACSACGAVWDQDENACRVLLKRAREQGDGGGNPGGARDKEKSGSPAEKPEKRRERMARQREEKAARKGGARKSVDNAAE